MRILLIDDEPSVRAIVAELLEFEGHTVVQAENGPDGLAMLATDRSVELVLADVGMPRMNGWTLAREVRTRYPSVRVGLITGYGITGPSDAAERSVVDFVIAKPITEGSLQVIRARGA
jgi:CheY-like chemotaxis protein